MIALIPILAATPARGVIIEEILHRGFDDPGAIVLDGVGNVYVAGEESGNVLRVRPDGTVEEIIDSSGDGLGNVLEPPLALAVDGAGNLYVAGQLSDNVFRIAPGGAVEEIIDSTGDGLGNALESPAGLSVDAAGRVYVAGVSSANVFEVAPDGTIEQIIDSSGDGLGNVLGLPRELALDGAGNVYVAGLSSDNVFRIEPDGTIEEIIDSTGDTAGGLLEPAALALDGAGNVYVAGIRSDNVFRVAPDGTVVEIIGPAGDGSGNVLDAPGSLAVDGAGSVYVGGLLSDNVLRVDPDGTVEEIIDSTGDGVGGTLESPASLVLDTVGNVYVTGFFSTSVFRVRSDGTVEGILDSTGDGLGNPLVAPGALAVDGAGSLYAAGILSDNVFRVAPDATVEEILDSTGDGLGHDIAAPGALAVDGAGNVYVGGGGSDNVFRVEPGGVVQEVIGAGGDGLGNVLDAPGSLAVDGSGNAYVAGLLSDNVFRVAPDGTVEQILDSTGDGLGNALDSPSSLAVDGAGAVYVAGRSSNNVFRVAPDGTISEVIDGTGDGLGTPLQFPESVAVDLAGNLYVADASVIFRVDPGGLVSVFAEDTFPSPSFATIFLAVDPRRGHLLAVRVDGSNEPSLPVVLRYEASGTLLESAFVLASPAGFASDRAGSWYVASAGGPLSSFVVRDDLFSIVIGSTGDGEGNGLSDPSGIAVDDAGNIYVAGSVSNNVFRISGLDCGDATVDFFETCDDGNTASGDCCSSTCQEETPACALQNIASPTPVVGDLFGFSIASAPGGFIVGAPGFDGSSGRAYLYNEFGHQLLTFENPTPGSNDQFGLTVAALGPNVLVGAPGDSDRAAGSGAAYLFDGVTGALLETFSQPAPQAGDQLGVALIGLGGEVLVGAGQDNTDAALTGSVYRFAADGTFLARYPNPSPDPGDIFGFALAPFDSTSFLVSATSDDDLVADSGIAYRIDIATGAVLATFHNPMPPAVGALSQFGVSIAVFDTTVAIGADLDDAGAARAGVVHFFDGLTGAFLYSGPNPFPADGDSMGRSVASVGGRHVIAGARGDDVVAADAGAVFLLDGQDGSTLEIFTIPGASGGELLGLGTAEVGSRVALGAPAEVVGPGSVHLFDWCGNGVTSVNEFCDAGVDNGAAVSCCTMQCGFRDDGASCDDGDAGTFGDSCAAGVCIGQGAVCGDGVAQGTEECDDGNVLDGDCCSATCQNEPAASPCPDGDLCNGDETCDGAGSCQGGASPVCDDENVCTQDSCDPGLGCVFAEAPAALCENAWAKASLVINEKKAGKEKLVAKLLKGPALSATDFGDPVNGSTAYDVCIYDDEDGLVARLNVDRAMSQCAGKDCYKAVGTKGYLYKDKSLSADGVQLIKLLGGAEGKSKILLKAQNNEAKGQLDLPVGMTSALAGSASATVQIHASGAPVACYGATVVDVVQNDTFSFKAK